MPVPAFIKERTGFLLQTAAISVVSTFEKNLAPLKLKIPHYVVLNTLSEGGQPSQVEIGCKVRFDRTKMVNVVDELEELGLVKREANPTDRRANILRMTDAGRAALEAARKIEMAVEDEFLATLTPLQRRQFQQTLTMLAQAHLQEMEREHRPGATP
ncbi:MAG: MarR family transcriptional regulator [Planctomycetota bacterium]|nr:MarR family transcriptional regulator [Planctomycetota bacterium]